MSKVPDRATEGLARGLGFHIQFSHPFPCVSPFNIIKGVSGLARVPLNLPKTQPKMVPFSASPPKILRVPLESPPSPPASPPQVTQPKPPSQPPFSASRIDCKCRCLHDAGKTFFLWMKISGTSTCKCGKWLTKCFIRLWVAKNRT